jgi:hypothetical protein
MKRALLGLLGLSAMFGCGSSGDSPGGSSAPLTYYDDMVPLFAEHCLSCHREGGIAPFRLDTYEQAKAYAATIRSVTQTRTMPPWGATSDGGIVNRSRSRVPDMCPLSDA